MLIKCGLQRFINISLNDIYKTNNAILPLPGYYMI